VNVWATVNFNNNETGAPDDIHTFTVVATIYRDGSPLNLPISATLYPLTGAGETAETTFANPTTFIADFPGAGSHTYEVVANASTADGSSFPVPTTVQAYAIIQAIVTAG
jgi:hypothetical protein